MLLAFVRDESPGRRQLTFETGVVCVWRPFVDGAGV
jgi:hypothetical protein